MLSSMFWRPWFQSPLKLAAAACLMTATACWAEDQQLRERALAMYNHARIASRLSSPLNVRTDIPFTATDEDGVERSGNIIRIRAIDGPLRQEAQYAGYKATRISIGPKTITIGDWDNPPFAVEQVLAIIPFGFGEFGERNVVRSIQPESVDGHLADCVTFETVEGERREPNTICYSRTNGAIINLREGLETFTYSDYTTFDGALLPGRITYNDGGNFRFALQMKLTQLESRPDQAFEVPAGATIAFLCRSFQEPLAISASQPAAAVPGDSPTETVTLHATIDSQGRVKNPHVSGTHQPALDAIAIETVSHWLFHPGTCNGAPNDWPIDLEVHFTKR